MRVGTTESERKDVDVTALLVLLGFFVALVLAFGVIAVACAMVYRIGYERCRKDLVDSTGRPMPAASGRVRNLRPEKVLDRENGASGG